MINRDATYALDATVPVSELVPDLLAHGATIYVYAGDEDDAPEAGDSSFLGWQGMIRPESVTHHGADAVAGYGRYVTVPYTAWSDYSGSDIDRANYIALTRDYADSFVDVRSGFGGQELMIPVDGTISGMVAGIIVHLFDYPLVDEETHSELVTELETEDWECWGRHDFVSDLRDAGVADAILDALDDTDVDAMFWAARSTVAESGPGDDYRTESAVSGTWDRDAWARMLAIVSDRMAVGPWSADTE